MDDVQKKAVKDLLHKFVDEEETALIQDLVGKLPASYQPFVQVIMSAVGPVAVSAEDKAIDAI